jgi:hypothetical protein
MTRGLLRCRKNLERGRCKEQMSQLKFEGSTPSLFFFAQSDKRDIIDAENLLKEIPM